MMRFHTLLVLALLMFSSGRLPSDRAHASEKSGADTRTVTVSPDALHLKLEPGGSETARMRIENTGDVALTWRIRRSSVENTTFRFASYDRQVRGGDGASGAEHVTDRPGLFHISPDGVSRHRFTTESSAQTGVAGFDGDLRATCGTGSFSGQLCSQHELIVEVSIDFGRNWVRILPVRGQPYLLDGTCMTPIDACEAPFYNSESIWVNGVAASPIDPVQSEAVTDVGWLSLSVVSGTLAAKSDIEIELTVDADRLNKGAAKWVLPIEFSGSESFDVLVPVDVEVEADGMRQDTESASHEFALRPNYPNPFNPATTITFALPTASRVVIRLFSVAGQEVMTVLDEERAAGEHRIEFDASTLSSGVYFYRLTAGRYTQTRRLTLIK